MSAPGTWIGDGGDDPAARLLRLAGARPSVPDTRAARVRTAVREQWVGMCRRRTLRRRAAGIAATAAAAAVFATAVARFDRTERPAAPARTVAVVERVEGVPAGAGLSVRDVVHEGQWIATDDGARVALRFSSGASVRLDVGSRARAISPRALELASGAVYVDTGGESGRFEVRTATATARDVGTQFEVRLFDRILRLRVRSGAVELREGARSISARGGTEITWSGRDAESRPVAAYGPHWEWTARLAPPLDIEGAALSVFLERTAREQGWSLHYADPRLAREASGIILHGSVRGLAPAEAIAVAIATSGLRHRLDEGSLVVFRGTAAP